MFRNLNELEKKEDQRVQRTRDRLGDALISLLVKKPFDDITVQDVLDRAGVSRSTFYAHYRDKNDLFLSDAEDFFESMASSLSRFGDPSKRVAPVQELFAHIGEMRPLYNALLESGRLHDVMQLGEEHFARGIEQRLSEMPRSQHRAWPSYGVRSRAGRKLVFPADLVGPTWRRAFAGGGNGQTVL